MAKSGKMKNARWFRIVCATLTYIYTTDYGRPVRKSPSLQDRKSNPYPKCTYRYGWSTDYGHPMKAQINDIWKIGCCRQNLLWLYFKIWDWDWIFGRAVKAISSLGVRSPWVDISSVSWVNIKVISRINKPKGFSASKCDEGNWILSKS